MKKLIILPLLATLALADYTQYKPSEDFAKYFTKQSCSQVLDKFYYLNCYDYNYKGTKAVAYRLEAENLKGEQIKKRPRFEDDTNIPKKYRTTWSDYRNSGYDRGHTLSNASMRKTTQAQRSTFLMSNITPQNPQINQRVWNKIEKRERQVALKLGSLEVLNLVNYVNNPQRIRNQIAIPSSYIKILKGENFKECYQVPNHEVDDEGIKKYKVNCGKIHI
ncbi:DNA/RNA non-specific endonuclease [Campylobacter coli]|uniref:DNA/RNA non-specific endonuclease n=1 Tax=Campylobacter coli TaxID=195 RepID=UPI0018656534|nr:DNA/RNA non-specific endonuclease [Campylobacter coli]ECP8901198.1 DNA/RNA non-specific endonuclease [Campylobacter coli]ECP9160567.1 DNA/RNA non-specific endonuclease [Campylobacter coli]MBE2877833.1 DNA/RNA non-specific endonuclease [Campylobacter coli]MBX2605499.1 DNA/RNA non-specific endonuclease [Campylobacter coli]MCK6636118.1 DNA/RNA non-specific endonuclease [Campylobacter coli]